MSSSSITASDGTVTVTTDDPLVQLAEVAPPPHPQRSTELPVIVHRDDHRPFDGGIFIAGLMLGMLALFIIQSAMKFYAGQERRRATSVGDSVADEVAALRRRTATLETIVTDPAQRTAREIEALR